MDFGFRGARRRLGVFAPRTIKRPSAVHVVASGLTALAAAAIAPLFPGQAAAPVQRIELHDRSAESRAQQTAAELAQRQALLDQAEALGLDQQADAGAGSARTASGHPVARAADLALALSDHAAPERIADRQAALADNLRVAAETRAADTESAIRRLGLNPRLLVAKSRRADAQGGPLLGGAHALGQPFERLAASMIRMQALDDALAAVPHSLPASLQYISSSFGYRSDPFTGEAALHSGLDFRGPIGAPIYAAAAGRVSFAGVRNGYGNCIEIDHGNGMVTRYAHMSAFRARVGQRIAAGDTIGAIGSTGRSTGPHLHFEVRINDQAVDPRPFLEVRRPAAPDNAGRG